MRCFLAFLFLVACDGGGGGYDVGPEPDASQFPPPSNVTCLAWPTTDAGDAGDAAEAVDAGNPCPPPPSTCADKGWLVYYDDGRCVPGNTCVWDTLFRPCNGGCSENGCVQIFTASVEPHLASP